MQLDKLDTYPKFNLRGSIGPDVSEGILEMFGGPESVSPSDLREFLDEHKDAPVVVIEISTPGGYINEAVEMFDMLRASGKEIVTIGYRVNSAGTILQLAGDDGSRFCSENVECVVHGAAIPPEALMGGKRLTAEEMERLSGEAEKENKRILNIYTKVLGKDKEKPLLALLGTETNIGAKGMLKYGFANQIYKGKKKELSNMAVRSFQVTPAFVNIIDNKIENPMNTKPSAFEKKFDAFMARVEKLFKAKAEFKGDVTLTTAEGVSINVVTDDETILNKQAQVDGANAPAGDHTLDDGRTITVDESGKITAVKDAEPPAENAKELERLKAELKAATDKNKKLEADLATATEANKVAVAAQKKLEKDVDAIRTEMVNFKKEITGDDGKDTSKKQKLDFTNETFKGLSPARRAHAIQMAKFAK